MNWTIARITLRERMTGGGRWISLGIFFFLPLLWAGSIPRDQSGIMGGYINAFLIWMVGAGIIGEEVSSGTILLVLSRPIRRSEYVFSKWIALGCATTGILLLQVGAIALVAAWREHPLGAVTTAQMCLEAPFRAFGAAAILVLFSSFISKGREVSAIIFTWAGGHMLELFGGLKDWTPLAAAGREMSAFVLPSVDLGFVFGVSAFSWPAAVSYLSSVVIALAVAVWWMNRREFSYAAG